MKLNDFKRNLLIKNEPSPIRTIKKDNEINNLNLNINKKSFSINTTINKTGQINSGLKIIGITGSKGKSTTAYLIHNYLKYIGYKSVLFSSIGIDSPAGYNSPDESIENPIRDEKMLLNAILQAEAYEADFLILEVNERAISKGLINGIPFDIRLITNVIPTHNNSFYTTEQYVSLKQSFFENIPDDEDCTCIFGIEENYVYRNLEANNNKKQKIFGTRYLSKVRGIDESKIDYLLYSNDSVFDSLDGLNFSIKTKNNNFNLHTKMIMPHNAMNILASVAVLDTLKVYDYDSFSNFILNITIPGRDKIIKKNNRTIIISTHLAPTLEILGKYKNEKKFNRLVVVTGSVGYGHKTWIKEYSDEVYENDIINSMKFAYNYINKYADSVYITTSDIGSKNPQLLLEMQSQLVSKNISNKNYINRKDAIKYAILDSLDGDLIFISGRGNRRIACISEDKVDLFQDEEIVFKTFEDLELTN